MAFYSMCLREKYAAFAHPLASFFRFLYAFMMHAYVVFMPYEHELRRRTLPVEPELLQVCRSEPTARKDFCPVVTVPFLGVRDGELVVLYQRDVFSAVLFNVSELYHAFLPSYLE